MTSRSRAAAADWDDDEQEWELGADNDDAADVDPVPIAAPTLRPSGARRSIEQLLEEKRLKGYLADVFDEFDE